MSVVQIEGGTALAGINQTRETEHDTTNTIDLMTDYWAGHPFMWHLPMLLCKLGSKVLQLHFNYERPIVIANTCQWRFSNLTWLSLLFWYTQSFVSLWPAPWHHCVAHSYLSCVGLHALGIRDLLHLDLLILSLILIYPHLKLGASNVHQQESRDRLAVYSHQYCVWAVIKHAVRKHLVRPLYAPVAEPGLRKNLPSQTSALNLWVWPVINTSQSNCNHHTT